MIKSLQKSLSYFLSAFLALTGCSQQPNNEWQGYIEGEFTYLAAPFAGTLQDIAIERGDEVKAGTKLFILDPQPQSSELTQAEQQLNAAQAGLKLAELRLTRAKQLVKQDASAQDALDEAQTSYDQQLATFKQAQAGLTKAKWAGEQKALTAPVDATVFDTYYTSGELVAEGQPVVALLAPQNIHAIFYVSEPQLASLKLGREVLLTCDSCQQSVTAKISYIAPKAEYTPPVIYSRSNNYKLVYRIEADLLAPNPKLHPGQPVYIQLARDKR